MYSTLAWGGSVAEIAASSPRSCCAHRSRTCGRCTPTPTWSHFRLTVAGASPVLKTATYFPVPLAAVHKTRLQWLDATDDMLAESRAFLFDHGYEAGLNIRAYKSKTRDAARVKLGLAPLKDRE